MEMRVYVFLGALVSLLSITGVSGQGCTQACSIGPCGPGRAPIRPSDNDCTQPCECMPCQKNCSSNAGYECILKNVQCGGETCLKSQHCILPISGISCVSCSGICDASTEIARKGTDGCPLQPCQCVNACAPEFATCPPNHDCEPTLVGCGGVGNCEPIGQCIPKSDPPVEGGAESLSMSVILLVLALILLIMQY